MLNREEAIGTKVLALHQLRKAFLDGE